MKLQHAFGKVAVVESFFGNYRSDYIFEPVIFDELLHTLVVDSTGYVVESREKCEPGDIVDHCRYVGTGCWNVGQ